MGRLFNVFPHTTYGASLVALESGQSGETTICGVKRFEMAERKDKTVPEVRDKPRKKTDAAFDLWLQRGLHQLYDDVANEPVPEALLRVIEEDRKK